MKQNLGEKKTMMVKDVMEIPYIQTLQNAGKNNIMKTNLTEDFIFGKVETRLGH